MRTQCFLCVVLTLSIAALWPLPGLSASPDYLGARTGILPGVGVGAIALDEPLSAVMAAWGPVTRLARNPLHNAGIADAGWRALALSSPGVRDGRVAVALGPLVSAYATNGAIDGLLLQKGPRECRDPYGITFGTTAKAVAQAYGEADGLRRTPSGMVMEYNSAAAGLGGVE